MFNTHIKFEISTITCNEEMEGHTVRPYGSLESALSTSY